MVFFPTPRLALVFGELFAHMGFDILELHSLRPDLNQDQFREEFREGVRGCEFARPAFVPVPRPRQLKCVGEPLGGLGWVGSRLAPKAGSHGLCDRTSAA